MPCCVICDLIYGGAREIRQSGRLSPFPSWEADTGLPQPASGLRPDGWRGAHEAIGAFMPGTWRDLQRQEANSMTSYL